MQGGWIAQPFQPRGQQKLAHPTYLDALELKAAPIKMPDIDE
jgi:hypothetical protein